MSESLLFIDFCCNDPRNGVCLGRCEAVHLPDSSMEIENINVKVDYENGVLTFGHLKLPHRGSRSWVGNWCWDGCWLTIPDTLKLLTYIKTLKHAHCTGGWCAIADPWEAGTLTEDILEREFFPVPKKPAGVA